MGIPWVPEKLVELLDWGTFANGQDARWNASTAKLEGHEPDWDRIATGDPYVTPHHPGDGLRVTGQLLFGAATDPNRLVWPSQVTPLTDDQTYEEFAHGTAQMDLVREVTETADVSWKDWFAGIRGEVQVNITDPSDPRWGQFAGLQGIAREIASPGGAYPGNYTTHVGTLGQVYLRVLGAKSYGAGLYGNAHVQAGNYTAAKSIYGVQAGASIWYADCPNTLSATGGSLGAGTINSSPSSVGGVDINASVTAFGGYVPSRVMSVLYGLWTNVRNTGHQVSDLWGQRLTYTPGGPNDHGGYTAPPAHEITVVGKHAGLWLEGWSQGQAISSNGGEVDLSTGLPINRGVIIRGAPLQAMDLLQLWSDPTTNLLYSRFDQTGNLFVPNLTATGRVLFGADLSSLVDSDATVQRGRVVTDTTGFDPALIYAGSASVLYYNPPNAHDPGLGLQFGSANYFVGSLGDLDGKANGGGVYGSAVGYAPQGTTQLFGGMFRSDYLAASQQANASLYGVRGTAYSAPSTYTSGGSNGTAIGGDFTGQVASGASGIVAGVQSVAIQNAGATAAGLYGGRFTAFLLGTGLPEAVGLRSSLTKVGSAAAYYGLKLLGWGSPSFAGGYAINSNGGQVFFNTGNLNNYGVAVQGVTNQVAPLFQGRDQNGNPTWWVLMDGSLVSLSSLTARAVIRPYQPFTPDGSNHIVTTAAYEKWTGTLVGDSLLITPVGGVDGQVMEWRVVQDATGGHTLSLDSGFDLGPITSFAIDLGANQVSYVKARYYSASGRWHVTGAAPNATTGGYH